MKAPRACEIRHKLWRTNDASITRGRGRQRESEFNVMQRDNGASVAVRAEVKSLLRALGYPPGHGGSVKAAIRRVSRLAGWSFERARSVWYGRAVIRADELETLRALGGGANGDGIKAEIAALRKRLEEIEARIARGPGGPRRALHFHSTQERKKTMRLIRSLSIAVAMIALPFTALASDVPTSRSAPVAHIFAAAPASSWTGFYVGGQLGYSWGNLDAVGLPVEIGTDGYFGGARLGFDYQIPNSRIVAGLLADVNVGNVDGSTTVGGISIPAQADLNGSLRARVGYAFDGFMLYGTGGLSAVKHDVSAAGFSGSKTTIGWLAGVGIEAKLYEHWSVGLEYLYRGRTDDNICLAPLACVPIRSDAQEVVGFVNYRF